MKNRNKMTTEERKEADYWMELRGEKSPEIRFQMMLTHCKGQCQGPTGKEWCEHRHGEKGITIKGKIILTPCNAKHPFLHCQKCGFEAIKEKLAEPVHGRMSRKKVNPDQLALI